MCLMLSSSKFSKFLLFFFFNPTGAGMVAQHAHPLPCGANIPHGRQVVSWPLLLLIQMSAYALGKQQIGLRLGPLHLSGGPKEASGSQCWISSDLCTHLGSEPMNDALSISLSLLLSL